MGGVVNCSIYCIFLTFCSGMQVLNLFRRVSDSVAIAEFSGRPSDILGAVWHKTIAKLNVLGAVPPYPAFFLDGY